MAETPDNLVQCVYIVLPFADRGSNRGRFGNDEGGRGNFDRPAGGPPGQRDGGGGGGFGNYNRYNRDGDRPPVDRPPPSLGMFNVKRTCANATAMQIVCLCSPRVQLMMRNGHD